MTVRKIKCEELRGLSRRLNAKGTESNFRSLEQIERYRHLAEEANQSPALVDALMESALILIRQGRLCEALVSFQDRMLRAPMDFSAQRGWRHLREIIHTEMLKLSEVDPECAEYGRTYEKLVEVGHASNRLHLGAVRYYLASGKIENASRVLLALAKVSPGAPGVSELLIRLAEVSDSVEVQKINIRLREEA